MMRSRHLFFQLEHQRLQPTLNIGIRKLRRIIQLLFEPQTRRPTGAPLMRQSVPKARSLIHASTLPCG
jgi:hypothetical protein